MYNTSYFYSSGNTNPLMPTMATPTNTNAHPQISFFVYILFNINLDNMADVAIIPHVNIELTDGGKKFNEI